MHIDLGNFITFHCAGILHREPDFNLAVFPERAGAELEITVFKVRV